jgi:hypothetical protein
LKDAVINKKPDTILEKLSFTAALLRSKELAYYYTHSFYAVVYYLLVAAVLVLAAVILFSGLPAA